MILFGGSASSPEVYPVHPLEDGEALQSQMIFSFHKIRNHSLAIYFDGSGIVISIQRQTSEHDQLVIDEDDSMAHPRVLVCLYWVAKISYQAELLTHF